VGQTGGVCLPARPGPQAGDAERGDGRDVPAAQVGDVPLDQEHLPDVRERQPVGGWQDLDRAGGDAPVALAGGGVSDGRLPGQGVDGGGAGAAPQRRYRPARTGGGMSAAQPEIAL
jgi:hypothetical protein